MLQLYCIPIVTSNMSGKANRLRIRGTVIVNGRVRLNRCRGLGLMNLTRLSIIHVAQTRSFVFQPGNKIISFFLSLIKDWQIKGPLV